MAARLGSFFYNLSIVCEKIIFVRFFVFVFVGLSANPSGTTCTLELHLCILPSINQLGVGL